MATKEIKAKIQESLESMSEKQLQSAWMILKELKNQEDFENDEIDKQSLDEKIKIGIQQLDNGAGTDFRQFLNEAQVNYGNKKQ